MTRRIAFILVALIALGLFAGSAAAQVISGEQFIVVRYYAGDVLVKTITVTPDGRSLQTVPNAGLVGSIDTAKAYLVEGKIETPIGLGGGSTGTGGTGLESRDAYLIGPEDRLAINVWENEQLTRDVPVRPDGMISMPLLGDIHAAGMTVRIEASFFFANEAQVGGAITQDMFVGPLVELVLRDQSYRGIPIKVRIPIRKLLGFDIRECGGIEEWLTRSSHSLKINGGSGWVRIGWLNRSDTTSVIVTG